MVAFDNLEFQTACKLNLPLFKFDLILLFYKKKYNIWVNISRLKIAAKKFHFYKQLNAMDCGPTCLRMIAKAYGRHFSADTLRQMTGFSKSGSPSWVLAIQQKRLGFEHEV